MLSRPNFEAKVISYATTWVNQYIELGFSGYSEEIHEEMSQEALLAITKILSKIKDEAGWMAYVQKRCMGAVKDYLKAGGAYEEEKRSIRDAATRKDGKYIFLRADTTASVQKNSDRKIQDVDLDFFISTFGVISPDDISDLDTIRWNLVARMSRVDRGMNYFARWLRGHTFDEIGVMVGHCKSTIGVHIEAFLQRFDDPAWSKDPWMKQTLYAFNLCDKVNIRDMDYSNVYGYPIGWNEVPVDLDGSQVGEPIVWNPEAPAYVG